MGASNYPGLKYPKGPGRISTATKNAAAIEAKRLEAYHLVDVRDGYRCSCCSRRGNPRGPSLLDKLHHDHIDERSLLGPDETWNLCLLCSRCHEKKGEHLIEPEGNPDAGTLIFIMARALAHEIFRGRRIPAHVRLREGA